MSLPDQELYEKISDVLLDNGITCFFTLPNVGETQNKMPYVYFGDVSLQQQPTKTRMRATASFTLNFYGTEKQRWEISELQNKMYSLLLPISSTESFKVVCDSSVTVNTITEETLDSGSIWHGTLDITYKVY